MAKRRSRNPRICWGRGAEAVDTPRILARRISLADSGGFVIQQDATWKLFRGSRRHTTLAVLSVILLSTLLRLPLLQWPFAEHPDGFCCGHPDEVIHYDLVRAFRSGSDPGSYPPGLAFVTLMALKTPAAAATASLVPAVASEDRRDQIRVIAMARILSLAFSGVAILFLYLICLEIGLLPWLAATAAPLLGLAPLYAVQTAYGLADALNVALVLASSFFFLRWHRRPALHLELLFGLLLGGVFAVKLVGVVIGIPLLLSMIARSPSRRRTSLAIGIALIVGVGAFSGGHLRFASLPSMFQKVVVENARAARIEPGWNLIHHALSLIAGMGALFVLLLLFSIGGWMISRVGAGRSLRAVRVLGSMPAVGIGSALYFLCICFSSNPFTRHMLPVYPFLILFVLRALGERLRFRASPRLRIALPPVLFACALGYNAFATWPLLQSFVHDPLDQASRWVRSETSYEPRLEAFRNFPPVRVPAGTDVSDGSQELMIVHSAWLGRFTGSWWLKAAPSDLRDVYHFEGTFEEVRFWQKLTAGETTEWRVRASFGDDWNTPERLFLERIGRGYDQFVTAGRAYVVTRNGPFQLDRPR